VGFAARLASYATFYAGALWHALAGPRPDVVLTLTTPPLLSLAGALAKVVRGVGHFIWEMDVYPDIAIDLGVFRRGSILDRITGTLADFSRRRSDRVIALSVSMRDRLIARGIPAEKVVVAENWADGSLIAPRPFPPRSPLTILYSGNFGRAHDVATIAGAMTRLSDPARFQFIFAGAGSRRPQLQSQCEAANVANAFFLAYQVQGRLAEHLGNCHAGLVTQLPVTCGSVVPSKTYAMMAAGRPFIYVGPAAGNPARLVERFGCGWRIEPGDSEALADLLELLAAKPELLAAAGERARQAFLDGYDTAHGVARILKILGLAEDRSPETAKAGGAAL
jgi:glycosyltransferase involved in cell wall biosynthesis